MPLQVKKVQLQLKDGDNYVDGDLLFNVDAQAWAQGTRNGQPIANANPINQNAPAGNNNAKYYSERSAAAAQETVMVNEDPTNITKVVFETIDDNIQLFNKSEIENIISAPYQTRICNSSEFLWRIGRYINPDSGNDSGNQYQAVSNKIDITPGDTIVNMTPDKDENNINFLFYINLYNNETFISRERIKYNNIYIIPDNVNKICFTCGYTTSTGISMTSTILTNMFFIKLLTKNNLNIKTYSDNDIEIISRVHSGECTWVQGSIGESSGGNDSASNSDHTKQLRTGYICANNADYLLINIPTGYIASFFIFSGNTVGTWTQQCLTKQTGEVKIKIESNYYFRVSLRKEDNSEFLLANLPENMNIYRIYYINESEKEFYINKKAGDYVWQLPKGITVNGGLTSGSGFALSAFIKVKPYDVFTNFTLAQDSNNKNTALHIASYKSDKVFNNRTDAIVYGQSYVVPSDVEFIRIMCGYPSSESVNITKNKLNTIFNMKVYSKEDAFLETQSINRAITDSQQPIYVAFGASTTVGAVHHLNGANVTYYEYAYPEYIGQVLNLNTCNLGQGTTGFMARDSGNKPNFMDQIYRNGDILSQASLVTITFGYGNDKKPSSLYSDTTSVYYNPNFEWGLGEWNDYYPYDQMGHFYQSSNSAANDLNVINMVNQGATLFGCLNWCIKWINDHYPKVQLVIICGAPSGNEGRKTVVRSNTTSGAGTIGIAPKKIVINPASDTGIIGNGYTIPQLSIIFSQLKENLNIPMIDLWTDGLPFSYYQTIAKNSDDNLYSIFSTKSNSAEDTPKWNSHPNEDGYLMYARYLAGRISQYYKH